MKRKLKLMVAMMVLAVAMTSFSACTLLFGKKITEISFVESKVSVELGEEKALRLNVEPQNYDETIVYSSSNEKKVSIDAEGKIKGVGIGKATITASTNYKKLSATTEVTVIYAPLRTLEIETIGVLNQVVSSGTKLSDITFKAKPNKSISPTTKFLWTVSNKETSTEIVSQEGREFTYSMPKTIGKTYVVTLSSGELSATVECGVYSAMRDVTLSTGNGAAVMGEGYPLTLGWPVECNENPEIKWYAKIADKAVVEISEGLNKKVLNFITKEHSAYIVYAVVDGSRSNSVSVSPSYNIVKSIEITSSQSVIKTNANIEISLNYDLTYVDPESEIKLEIFENGEVAPTYTTKKLAKFFDDKVYSQSYSKDGIKTFYVKLNGIKSNELVFDVKVVLTAPSRILLSTNNNLKQIGAFEAVNFIAAVEPVGAVNNVQWYVNDVLQSATGTSFVYLPVEEGEYHIRAKIGNVESKYVTIACANSGSLKAKYFDIAHSYGGYEQNGYISNQRELNNTISNAIANGLYAEGSPKLNLFIDYDKNISIENKISKAYDTYVESGVMPSFPLYSKVYVGEVSFNLSYDNTSDRFPTKNTARALASPQLANVTPHYKNVSGARTLYIDNQTEYFTVTSTNMLYKALQWGYKPQIVGENATTINKVYAEARKVLNKIIIDDMTDYEKVHAIYDWLCFDVTYDTDLSEMPVNRPVGMTENQYVLYALNEKMKFYGYYLEGVFLNPKDRRAVCDGKAKAFVLMCGMEGISAIRVSGVANGGGHAWNKVLLDADENGEAEWYFIDSTWGDSTVSGQFEVLSHNYFLASDDENPSHVEKAEHNFPPAKNTFDYYDATVFVYDEVLGKDYVGDLLIDGRGELKKLFQYASQNGLKGVEFKMNYSYVKLEDELRDAISGTGFVANGGNFGYITASASGASIIIVYAA
ncbi:MAG: Ig-like domain-containing protein [Clostridia bacterium]